MKTAIRVLLGVLGVGLLVAGIAKGDYGDTLQKAVLICMECVGIG